MRVLELAERELGVGLGTVGRDHVADRPVVTIGDQNPLSEDLLLEGGPGVRVRPLVGGRLASAAELKDQPATAQVSQCLADVRRGESEALGEVADCSPLTGQGLVDATFCNAQRELCGRRGCGGCELVEDDGEPDAAVHVVGWWQGMVGGSLGDGGNAAGEGFDDPGSGLRGADVLADRDQSGVAGGGHRVAPEPVDGDAVQAAGIGHYQAVPQKPHFDGQPGGPVVEVAVDQRVGDQLTEGDERVDRTVMNAAIRFGDDGGVEGTPGPEQRRVQHPRNRSADGDLVAGPSRGGVGGQGLRGGLDDVAGEPLLGMDPESE